MASSRSSRDSRVSALEGKQGACDIRLNFADGSSRGVEVSGKKNDRLKMLLATFAKARAYPSRPLEGEIVEPPIPEPATEFDALIDLMGAAESVEGDRLFHTIHGMSRAIVERKKRNG
jgi:hypothetical protein